MRLKTIYVRSKCNLRIADQRARLLGLYPKEPQVHFNLPAGDQPETTLLINFVVPSRKEEPPPVDVTLQGPPDCGVKALEPPPRRVETPFGIVERPGPKDWMK
jgi:hypothetical protein